MLQALVMAIATQICNEVAIRDIDDYTIAFRFKSVEGAALFVEQLSEYQRYLQFTRLGLDILVSFADD